MPIKSLGLSLLELMIVLLLISLISLLAIPSFQRLIVQNSLAAETQRLVTAINYTRMLAIEKHCSITLCPSDDNKTCGSNWSLDLLVFIDPLNKNPILQSFPGENPSKNVIQWNRSINIITMSALGLLQSQNGSFIVSDKHHELSSTVILSRTGRVRVENGEMFF